MTWLWEVLQLLGLSTTVGLMMYNVLDRDVLQLNERCMTFILCYYYPVICIQLFQFRPQAPCQKGIAAESTALQPCLWHTLKGGQVVSVLSALTYGLNFVSPELNFIHRRAEVCSPPRWKLASCRLISDQSSEESVLIKQRVCLPWIEALFILNTGSVWGKCRFLFNLLAEFIYT